LLISLDHSYSLRYVIDPPANKNPPSIAMAGQAEWTVPQKDEAHASIYQQCPSSAVAYLQSNY
jgi:hypothetical protein